MNFKKNVFEELCSLKELHKTTKNTEDEGNCALMSMQVNNLNAQLKFFMAECVEKNKIIAYLTTSLNENKVELKTKRNEKTKSIEPEWKLVNKKHTTNTSKAIFNHNPIIVSNRFNNLDFNNKTNECVDSQESFLFDTNNDTPAEDYDNAIPFTNRTIKTNRRPQVTFNENYIQNSIQPKVIPGKNTYANSVKRNKFKTNKVCVIGDSIIKRIRRMEFNANINNATAYLKTFPGANIKQLHHYIEPSLIDDCPDAVILHIGTNDLKHAKNQNENPKEIAMRIIDIGNKCIAHGVQKVFISEILQRSNASLNKIIHEINNILQDLCTTNNFLFIAHTNISMDHLYDEVHLNNDGMNILANNFINILNENLL